LKPVHVRRVEKQVMMGGLKIKRQDSLERNAMASPQVNNGIVAKRTNYMRILLLHSFLFVDIKEMGRKNQVFFVAKQLFRRLVSIIRLPYLDP